MVENYVFGVVFVVFGYLKYNDLVYVWMVELKCDGDLLFVCFEDINLQFEVGVEFGVYCNCFVFVFKDQQCGWCVCYVGWFGVVVFVIDGLWLVEFVDGQEFFEFVVFGVMQFGWGFEMVVCLFCSVCEWLIGDCGQDVVDVVVFNWQIDFIEEVVCVVNDVEFVVVVFVFFYFGGNDVIIMQ